MSDQNTTMRPDSPLNQKYKRKSGFYWVSYLGEWRIAEYFPMEDNWFLTGEEKPFETIDFTEIDERPIVRDYIEKPKITGQTERIPQNE